MHTPFNFVLQRPQLIPSSTRGQRKIAPLMTATVRLRAGDVLMQGGKEHDYVYRVRSGWMCRIRVGVDQREQIIMVFLPGDYLGIKSMFLLAQPEDVIALSPCVLERVHYQVLLDAVGHDADITHTCLWQLIEEERRLHGWIFGLGQGSAEERMALLLVDLRGRLITSGNLTVDALTFGMPLSQSQLAEHLGITQIHVNRVLKAFRERGILTMRSKEVTIQSLQALRQIAEPMLDDYQKKSPNYWGVPPHRERSASTNS